jgi:hypothetical protein
VLASPAFVEVAMGLSFVVVPSLAGLVVVILDVLLEGRRRKRALRGHVATLDGRHG